MESRCTVARLIRRRMHMDVHGECHGRPCIKMVLVYHAATLQDVSRGSWRWCWRPCCAFTFFSFSFSLRGSAPAEVCTCAKYSLPARGARQYCWRHGRRSVWRRNGRGIQAGARSID